MGAFTQHYDPEVLDSSLLMMPLQGLIAPRDPMWLYTAFAMAYRVCETMNGNWSQLDMTTRLGASATQVIALPHRPESYHLARPG